MFKLLVFTAIMGVILFVVGQYIAPEYIHPQIWLLLAFFFALALISHRITSRGMQKNKDNIVVYYFSTMLIRLVVSLGVLLYFMYTKTPEIFLLVFNFFILYLFYMGFEINWLLTNLRRNSKQAGES
jgi:O-antigen/teichoic acid export membrane protein